MMRRLLIAALFLGLIGSGCAEKKEVKPEETKPELEQQAKEKGETQKGPEKITEQTAKVESKEIPSKSEEVSGMFEDVFFEFNKYDISDRAKPVLKAAADYLLKNTGQKLLIEGHCDARGTAEYNLGLGDRRATAVRKYLEQLGVDSKRLEILSKGSTDAKQQGGDKEWAKDRRVDFVVLKK